MSKLRNIAVTILLLAMAACGFLPETRFWTEDVQLEDGSLIKIKRYVSFGESNSWAGDAYSATETKATITFTGALQNLPPWDAPLMPIVLYREAASGEWVVVATSTRCEVWSARGKPLPPYWEFHLTPTGWRERALSNGSIGRSANLFSGYTGMKSGGHLTLKDKYDLRAAHGVYPLYGQVLAAVSELFCS